MAETLLPHNATSWMRAVEDASSSRWLLAVDRLTRSVDPLTCPAYLLPWLAQTRGLDLWFDDWLESTKRRAIAAMPRLSRLKGTVAGIRAYLDLVDVPVTYVQTPPGDGWFGGDLSEADRAAWLGRLPQLRLYPYRDLEDVQPGDGFVDLDFLNAEDDPDGSVFGDPALPGILGERLYIWRGGVETELTVLSRSFAPGPLGDRIETAVVAEAGPDTGDAFGDAAVDDLLCYGAADGLLSVRLQPAASRANLRPVPFSPRVVDAPFEQVFLSSEPVEGEQFFGVDFVVDGEDAGLFGADDAPDFVFRRSYLEDADVDVPDLEGDCLWGDHIFDFPSFTAIVGVDLSEPIPDGEDACDGSGLMGSAYFDAPAFPCLERAVEAVKRAQGGTDVILLDTVTFTPLVAGDAARLGDQLKLGQMIERHSQ